MITFKSIGTVKSAFHSPGDPFKMLKQKSTIVINEDMAEGLHNIEKSPYIDIVFVFHKSEGYSLRTRNYLLEDKGVFATRSPKRPNAIGITTVKLLEKNGRELKVKGLDAIEGTPVLDIKPSTVHFYKNHFNEIITAQAKQNPRTEILRAIKGNDLEALLLEAAKMHGHFCPGLALGVKAATYAMQKIRELSDGMEDLIAITETNNCFSDGVQLITGCSFGNNALIFKDWGKTAFTLATRNGKGIRVRSLNNSREHMQKSNEEFFEQFRKVVIEKNHDPQEKDKLRAAGTKASFSVVAMDFNKLFEAKEVKVEIPEYAPIHESIVCGKCGENTMATRIVDADGKKICLSCHSKDYYQLDGHGISCF